MTAAADGPATSSGWLVSPPEDPPSRKHLRVWLPAALTAYDRFEGDGAADAAARLSYVVVDEIVGDAVGLTIAPWPYADDEGRLRFLSDHRRLHVGMPKSALEGQLYAEDRAARIGDVFGAELKPGWDDLATTSDDPSWVHRADELFQGTVYDLTQAARTVSKLAYYGAATSVLSSTQAEDDNLLDLEQPREERARKREQPPAVDEGPAGGRQAQ